MKPTLFTSTRFPNKKPSSNKSYIHSEIAQNHASKYKKTNPKIDDINKQNIDITNYSFNAANQTYKPSPPPLKKPSKLELFQKTINLLINDSSSQKNNLLDTLLYGQFNSNAQSCFFNQIKQNDQLLLQPQDSTTFNYKQLSPIKSIDQSFPEIDNTILIASKVQSNYYNVLLTLRQPQKQIDSNITEIPNCILLQRLLILIQKHPKKILQLHYFVHKARSKRQLQQKIREYLFQNSIIFNKKQLNEFIQCVDNILKKLRYQSDVADNFSESSYGMLLQHLFLKTQNYEQSKQIWIIQDVINNAFYNQNIISLWKLSVQLLSQKKQVSTSTTLNESVITKYKQKIIGQTDLQKKKQSLEAIGQWISNFIKTTLQPNSTNDGHQIIIKISQPLMH